MHAWIALIAVVLTVALVLWSRACKKAAQTLPEPYPYQAKGNIHSMLLVVERADGRLEERFYGQPVYRGRR
jgi:hypothetical protein